MATILIIDDRQDNLDIFESIVITHVPGCSVLTATGGKKALKIANSVAVDVILLDLNLPEMDGIEICRRLRAEPKTAHIPVIMITGMQTDADLRIAAYQAGVDAFVPKPINPLELAALIQVMLRIKRAEDEISRGRDILECLVIERTRAIEERENKYRTLFNNTNDMVFVHDIAADHRLGRFIEVNSQACEQLGYTRMELLHLTPYDIIIHDSKESSESRIDTLLKYKKLSVRRLLKSKDGRHIPVNLRSTIIDIGGKSVVIATAQDLTEHVSKLTLDETKTRYQALFEGSRDGVYLCDLQGNFIDANPAALEMLGYDKRDISALNWETMLDPDQLNLAFRTLDDLMKTGVQKKPVEFRLRRPGGGAIWAETMASIIYKDGIPVAIQGIARDITDRKRAESALKESEKKFHEMFWSHSAVMLLIDPATGSIRNANAAAERFYGYSTDTLTAMKIQNINQLPEDQVFLAMQNAVQQKHNIFIFKHKLANNEIRTVEVHSSAIDIGSRILLFSIIHDITARVQAEEALAKSKERYQGVVDNLPIFICRFLPGNTIITFVNDRYCEYFQRSRDSLIGHSFMELVPENEREYIKSHYSSLSIDRPVITYELRTLMPSGERWHRWVDQAIFDSEGEIIEYQSIGEDITERKKLEEARRRSDEKYRLIFQDALVGIFQSTPAGHYASVNPTFARMYGYASPREMMDSVTDIAEQIYVNPDDRRTITGILAEHGVIHGFETRQRRKDGSIFWISINARAAFEIDGSIAYYEGTVIDITERRRLEQEIVRISMEEQQRIGQDLHDTLGQILTGTGFLCEALKAGLPKKSVHLHKQMEEIILQIKEAKIQTRNLSRGLCPVNMQSGGIISAIEALKKQITDVYKCRFDFDHDENLTIADSTAETQLYYIVHEAVTNAVRHAGTPGIHITLKQIGGHITALIEDHGNGTTAEHENNNGLGLRIMRYRARIIGASLHIYRNEHNGTTVSCVLQ